MQDKDKKVTVTITREQFVTIISALNECNEPHKTVVGTMETLVEQAREYEKKHPSEDDEQDDEEEKASALA